MRERRKSQNARMVNDPQGAEYCGMGLNTFKKWALEIGAVKRFGNIKRNDLKIIDEALDAWPAVSSSKPGEKIDDQFVGDGDLKKDCSSH